MIAVTISRDNSSEECVWEHDTGWFRKNQPVPCQCVDILTATISDMKHSDVRG